MTMTMAEMPTEPTTSWDELAPDSADEVYDALRDLEPRLQSSLENLHAMGVREPSMFEVPVKGGNRLFVVDASTLPGKAFKYYGAAPAVAWSKEDNPEMQRVSTGSAGNFSLTMAEAAGVLGLGAEAHTPREVNPAKEKAMRDRGVEVKARYDNVMQAIEGARMEAEDDPETVFLHPFNHPYAIKGQQLLTRFVLNGLAEQGVDLQNGQQKRLLWQRGGGSGIAGASSEVFSQKEDGRVSDSFEVHEVRPVRLPGGQLNPRFDGLAVDRPGSWSAPLLKDERFVQGHQEVSEREVALAACLLVERDRNNELTAENSALVGLAAALAEIRQGAESTTYVTVLSGGNVAPGSQEYFNDLLSIGAIPAPQAAVRPVANKLLSGFTADRRTGLVTPRSTHDTHLAVSPDVRNAHYEDLEDWGVTLVRR
jgi:threonine dehydratase